MIEFINFKALSAVCAALILACGAYIFSLRSEAADLRDANAALSAKAEGCELSLKMQNAAIASLEIKATNLNDEKISKVSKIYVRDESCEAKLNAYKKLFASAF